MTRTLRIVAASVVAIVALGAGVVAFQRQQAATQAAADARAATEAFYSQTLADATGVPRQLSGYRGQVVVVNFWATWCVPCVKEIPAFSRVQQDFGGRVAFVGLGIDSPTNIASFNDRVKPSYPLFAASAVGTDLARVFGDPAGGLPFTVIIGRDGRIAASHLGTVDDRQLRVWLEPLAAAVPK